ncbi:MAG: transcriptional regulator [Actinobacteria bacterium HGW-Actinobacteria-4]|nr:MAG: transcriptional regulator [Actinobacteria bacterium HGW-Actinobacteria-4]
MPTPLYVAKAELFRTLGHPVRIRVLELLQERPRPVHELLAQIDIEPSSMSQQLAVLRRAGVVSSRRNGRDVIYSLSADDVSALLTSARTLLTSVLTDNEVLVAQLRSEAAAP